MLKALAIFAKLAEAEKNLLTAICVYLIVILPNHARNFAANHQLKFRNPFLGDLLNLRVRT